MDGELRLSGTSLPVQVMSSPPKDYYRFDLLTLMSFQLLEHSKPPIIRHQASPNKSIKLLQFARNFEQSSPTPRLVEFHILLASRCTFYDTPCGGGKAEGNQIRRQ